MPQVTVIFNQTEFEAISEYAKMCQEKIPDLIRKIVIQDATFMRSKLAKDPQEYEYGMLVPTNTSIPQQEKIIESNYNKIRKILGWSTIKL